MSWVILDWLIVVPPLVHHPPRSHADAGGLDVFLLEQRCDVVLP